MNVPSVELECSIRAETRACAITGVDPIVQQSNPRNSIQHVRGELTDQLRTSSHVSKDVCLHGGRQSMNRGILQQIQNMVRSGFHRSGEAESAWDPPMTLSPSERLLI